MKNLLTRIVFAVAFVAILARAAIPAGYMPDLNSDKFQMVICTINGAKTIDVGGNFDPKQPHSQKSSDICDFSVVKNLTLDTPDFAALSVILAISFVAFQIMRSQIARSNLRFAALQPRAPPLSI